MDLREFFEEHNDEFLKFDRVKNNLSNRADLHAFLLLDKLFPSTHNLVASADHDEIFLDVDSDKLAEVATEEQLIDLHRCGVFLFQEYDSIGMFV